MDIRGFGIHQEGDGMADFAGKFQRIVFVVSTGRTGTMALAQHLDRCYDDVCARHEPRPSWRLRRASAKAISSRISLDRMRQLLADSRKKLLSGITRPIYIESNPYLCGFLDVLGEVFDKPRVLHVVRDPRTYVRSALNWGAMRSLKYLANTFIPFWIPKPEHVPGSRQPRWRQMSQAERMAWFWSTVNRELNRGQEIYGDDYLRIRFEDLFAKDGTGLKKLTEWIGLPYKPELLASANSENVNASRKQQCPSWKDWPADRKEQVLRHCRELMMLYGYDGEDRRPAARPAAEGEVVCPS
jgi:hypothetical protein